MTTTNHNPLRIVIVGGVAGGASAATRARRSNEHAQIILFEKDQYVSFANCGLPYYIGGQIADRKKLLVATPQLFTQRFNIDVRVRQQVMSIDTKAKMVGVLNHETSEQYNQPYDKLILAPGAAPIVPPIDGVDSANVFTLRNLEDTDRIKQFIDTAKPGHAVVVGAGFIGLEMVEQLGELSIKTAVVELQSQVLPLFDTEMANVITQSLQAHGVDVHLGDGIAGIDVQGRQAIAVNLSSGAKLATDLVILGIGVRPNISLAQDAGLEIGPAGGIAINQHAQSSEPDIYAVGDAAEYRFGPTGKSLRVPLAGPANRSGRLAGEHAATGNSAPLPDVYGTAIVRVFDKVAALTGLSARLAKRLEIAHATCTIIANNHAGYYPGGQPMILKLIYAPDSGKILGAQAIGGEGVDKRIDVVATAMAMGGSVRDLAGLDLAYAPPFGSAKDPVHMAAFVATNQLDGLIELVEPGTDLNDAQVVDVRTDKETQTQPLLDVPHAINIPIDQLRQRIDELDPALKTVAICASGLRSYVAGRILKQRGFAHVASLSGGSTLRRHALENV